MAENGFFGRRTFLKWTVAATASALGIPLPNDESANFTESGTKTIQEKPNQIEVGSLDFHWTIEEAISTPKEFLHAVCKTTDALLQNNPTLPQELVLALQNFQNAFQITSELNSLQMRRHESLYQGLVEHSIADRLLALAGKDQEELLVEKRMLVNPLATPAFMVAPFSDCVFLFKNLTTRLDAIIPAASTYATQITELTNSMVGLSEWFSIYLESSEYDVQKEILVARAQRFDIDQLIEALKYQIAVAPVAELTDSRETEWGESLELWERLLVELHDYFPLAFPTLGRFNADPEVNRSHYDGATETVNLNADYTNLAAKILEKAKRLKKESSSSYDKDIVGALLRAVTVTIHEFAHHFDPNRAADNFFACHPEDVLSYLEEYDRYLLTIWESFGGGTVSRQPLPPHALEAIFIDPLTTATYGVDQLSFDSAPEELRTVSAELSSIRQIVGYFQNLENNGGASVSETGVDWFVSPGKMFQLWNVALNQEIPPLSDDMSLVEKEYLARIGLNALCSTESVFNQQTFEEIFQTATPLLKFDQLTVDHVDQLEAAFDYWYNHGYESYSVEFCDAVLALLLRAKSFYLVTCWQTFLSYGVNHFTELPSEVLTSYLQIEIVISDYLRHIMTGPAGHYFDSFGPVTGELVAMDSQTAYQQVVEESRRLRQKYAELLGNTFDSQAEELQQKILQHQITLQELRAVLWGVSAQIDPQFAYRNFVEQLIESDLAVPN